MKCPISLMEYSNEIKATRILEIEISNMSKFHERNSAVEIFVGQVESS